MLAAEMLSGAVPALLTAMLSILVLSTANPSEPPALEGNLLLSKLAGAEMRSAAGRDVYGLDVTMDALEWVRKRGFQKITQASVTDIPFRSETFDLVFSFDVLPQVPLKTDEPAIREMHRVLKPNGYLFVRAAAFEWLRSSHDEDLHTMHRFTRPELVEKLIGAGFDVEWSSYANGFLFPVILLRRFLKHAGIGKGTDVRPLPRGLGWLDSIFRNVLSRESGWFRSGRNLPFGLSVICWARKKSL